TKVGVFAAAAIATIPLAHFLGSKAWIGLAVFGLVLVGLTVAVLSIGKAQCEVDSAQPDEGGQTFEDPETAEPVHLPVEDFIDLHPFPPRDIPAVVESYLGTALAQGYSEVRLIHGRGIGVQRERIRSTLSRHPAVVSFSDAPPDRGGWGATVVRLRRVAAAGDGDR
ncbi:MAG: Smr/MutS family protein, partial [Acidobacteriota bacterium]